MRTERKVINLFEDKSTFSIKHVISIDSEDDLNQFWDFLTVSNGERHELINAFVTQFYNFALSYMTNDEAEFFEIILEESEKDFYFTLWNKKISLLFKIYIQKTHIKYIFNGNQITVKFEKLKLQKKIQKINYKNEQRQKKLIDSVTQSKKIKKREPYTFLEADDLQELLRLSEDMQELMMHSKKNGLDKYVFISLRSKVSLFCLLIRYYDKIAPIATTLTYFSNLINQNREKFIKLDKQKLELINGFIANIDYWLQTLFVNGGADIYFMDNSMKADYYMIAQLINPSEEKFDELELDDIFNF